MYPQVDSSEAIKRLWHQLVLDLVNYGADIAVICTFSKKPTILYSRMEQDTGMVSFVDLKQLAPKELQPLFEHVRKMVESTTLERETAWEKAGFDLETTRTGTEEVLRELGDAQMIVYSYDDQDEVFLAQFRNDKEGEVVNLVRVTAEYKELVQKFRQNKA